MRSLALILPALLAMPFVAPRVEAQLGFPTGQTTPTGGLGGTPAGAGTTTTAQGPVFVGQWKPIRIINQDGTETELKAAENIFINEEQCNAQFIFEFQNVSPRAPVMELWVSNTTTDCSAPTSRTISASNPQPLCWPVAEMTNVRGTGQKFPPIPGREIFNLKRKPVDDLTICEEQKASDTPYYLWFIPVGSQTVPETGTASAATASPYRIRLNLFTLKPPPATGVKVRGGESAITVEWNNDPDPLIRYRAFFNVGTDPAVCGTGALTPAMTGNEVVSDGKTTFSSGRLNKPSATLKDLDDKGIPYGTQVAVAVASEDRAGNIGPLSEPQCATRIETVSAIDACGGVEDCGLETCGLSPASRGSWFGLSLFVLALAALIRRRTT